MTTRGFSPRRAPRPPRPRSSSSTSRPPRPHRRTSRHGDRRGVRPRPAAWRGPLLRWPRTSQGDVRVGEARPLDAQEVVRNEVVEPQFVELARELGSKPRMRAVCELPDLLAVELARAPRLAERFDEGAPDAHRLADRLHLRSERRVGAGELLERKARELDDDVVERRLEARGRGAGEIVRDLVERVADRELRGHLGDRVAGRLRGERRGAGDTRVHLDHAELSRVTLARELDVRSAALDAHRPDHGRRRVAQLLIRVIRQRHLRRDRHGVPGVDSHRIDVLDRADDHHVVLAIAHDLELELVPAAHRFLDEHLSDRALGDAELDLAAQLLRRLDEAAAVAAERKCRSDHRRGGQTGQLGNVGDDARVGCAQPDRVNGVTEELAILRAPNDVERCSDQLDAEILQDAGLRQLLREVESRLAAHRRQKGVGPLASENIGDALEVERLEIRAIREPGVGHDRRGIRVHDDRAEAVLPQDLQRLAARVVELAGLPDHDRAGADQADRLEITPPGHTPPPRPTVR